MAIFRTSSILVFIILISITSSSTCHKPNDTYNAKQLCSKASCFLGFNKFKKSDNHSVDFNVKGLSKVLVQLTSESAKLKSFAKKIDDWEFTKKYNLCSKNYNDAIHTLEDAKKRLQSGDYNVCVQLHDAYEDIKSCRNTLNEEDRNPFKYGKYTDPYYEYILKKNNDLEYSLCAVEAMLLTISKRPNSFYGNN
ncbi:hypothetical protein CASFOL_028857 [Castilleja foliolosa]|uniref:Pectinesterase inhibitor domain-containing protein n=1 Tax=Castilleja foliolosa TaxID=1961234 RepID=A0ABD3CCB4_9LAMI